MAHVYAVRAVLPGMLERGEGYLVHTASMAGILTTHGNAHYAVSKHAVVGLAEWLSVTYHDRGIRTSCLAPLGVRTPMLGDPESKWAKMAAGNIKEPEEVAEQVLDAIAEERFLILTDPLAERLEQTTLDNMSKEEACLLELALMAMEVAPAVEYYNQPDVPNSVDVEVLKILPVDRAYKITGGIKSV